MGNDYRKNWLAVVLRDQILEKITACFQMINEYVSFTDGTHDCF